MKSHILLFFSAITALKIASACRPVCWAEELGYPCCEPTNTEIISIDEKGNEWGMENGKQCGILIYDTNMKGCGQIKTEPKECDIKDCSNIKAVGDDGTLWGISSKTKQKCFMNTEDKNCKLNIQNSCWSALLGYPCCKEYHKDLYQDKDGLWSIENGKWCGVEYCPDCSTAEVESIDKYQNIWSTDKINNRKCIIKKSAECSFYMNSKCRSASIGYMCCKETKKIVLQDRFGFWGIENGQWCGFNEQYPCDWYEKKGYTCCKTLSQPVKTNEDGIFGLEDGSYCGLTEDITMDY